MRRCTGALQPWAAFSRAMHRRIAVQVHRRGRGDGGFSAVRDEQHECAHAVTDLRPVGSAIVPWPGSPAMLRGRAVKWWLS